ncbi:UNVERIFIED_CONTAM: hypothetical protein K2H54_051423 [Gekko kuhli]
MRPEDAFLPLHLLLHCKRQQKHVLSLGAWLHDEREEQSTQTLRNRQQGADCFRSLQNKEEGGEMSTFVMKNKCPMSSHSKRAVISMDIEFHHDDL